jgi:hypothetical protein
LVRRHGYCACAGRAVHESAGAVMSVIADLIRAGADLELVAKIEEAIEQAIESLPTVAATVTESVTPNRNALRQKRYRERNSVTSLVTLKGEGGISLSLENREVSKEARKEGSPLLGKPSTRMPPAREDFEAFWKSYPKHENKAAALRKYVTVLRNGVTHERVTEAALRYAQSVTGTDRQFIKAPDVWLNKGCYDDELPLANGHDAPAKDTRTKEQRDADWKKYCQEHPNFD